MVQTLTYNDGLVTHEVNYKQPKRKDLFLSCSCESEILRLSKWEDEDEVYFTVYSFLADKYSFWERLKILFGGKTKSILKAPLMLNVQDATPYIEFPNSIHADFYNENGQIESKLTARYGKYKQNQSNVFLRDSVKVINIEKGDTLYCDELYWDRNRVGTEFYTDKPVRIRTKTQLINGRGMESSQDFKNWHIIHSEGFITIPASKFPG